MLVVWRILQLYNIHQKSSHISFLLNVGAYPIFGIPCVQGIKITFTGVKHKHEPPTNSWLLGFTHRMAGLGRNPHNFRFFYRSAISG